MGFGEGGNSLEVPKGWGKDITGRLVTFKDGSQLSWGVELSVPIDPGTRKYLSEWGVEIPAFITTLKYLDLAPQESLPEKQRNIKSHMGDQEVALTHLNSLTGSTLGSPMLDLTHLIIPRPYKTLRTMFRTVLTSRASRKEFNDLLANTRNKSEMLFVYGHGNYDPFHLGEQSWDEPEVKDFGKIQRAGNSVSATEVLEKYNDQTQIAAIIFRACYKGENGIRAKNIPVVYPWGFVSNNFVMPLIYKTKTKFSYPDVE